MHLSLVAGALGVALQLANDAAVSPTVRPVALADIHHVLSASGALAPLTNQRIRATVGARGLTTFTDLATGRSYRLTSDDFTISIDGVTIDSRALPTPTRRAQANGVTLTWRAGASAIDAVYELKPGWGFISKQLVVRFAASRTARIGRLVPLRASLGETPTSHFNPGHPRADLHTKDYGTALRFRDGTGMLVVAQNPFLQIDREGPDLSLAYDADMTWRADDGDFPVDRVLIAPYRLSGRVLPSQMRAEWLMHDSTVAPGLDEREIEAFTAMVRAFLVYQPTTPTNVFVGWTANDYQIDVGTSHGRDEYRRVIERAAAVGAKQIVYAPANSELSRRRESSDDWSWEYVLWLGLGEQIRRGEWNIATSEVPPTIKEMVGYAADKGVGLLAYVYPVLGFTQDTSWLVRRSPTSTTLRADLGVRALQDWLIDALVTFHRRTGVAGYSFDHTFLTLSKTSRYAQWFGWRRVMEELRRRVPDIVIDGRQAYHQYGPWSWLAGSYPHPTANDEQPESFIPFPGLHFDRVSADRERYTAYRYRNYDFAPSELVPGYMTHQTPRGDDTGDMPEAAVGRDTLPIRFRARDWDYLGWRYSVLSSIALGGWNNVIDMIPARDSAEYSHFAAEDIGWWRGWIEWTASHKELLRLTRTIVGPPRVGGIDGTAAMQGDSGYVFLFNPNGRRLSTRFPLSSDIGLTSGTRYALEEVYPQRGRRLAHNGAPAWSRGDSVEVAMDGQSALVLRITPVTALTSPTVYGVTGSARVDNETLQLSDVRGEPGTTSRVDVALPPATSVRELQVNGVQLPFTKTSSGISTEVRFGGQRMGRFHPVVAYDSTNTGGRLVATLTIPARIRAQLAARRAAWPIPWTPDDYRATWLAPERLLLYVQLAEADDSWDARLAINGQQVELRKAYTAIRPARHTFVGFYADLSLLESDRTYQLTLELPRLKAGQLQGVYLENIETEYVTDIAR